MTDTFETIEIGGNSFLLPDDVITKTHKHRKKDKWVSMWFYKDHKKNRVFKKDIKDDFIITSKLEYQKGIFYKMSQLSAEDDCFDYYYKLKDGVSKNIVKKNQRYKVCNAKRNAWKDQKPSPERTEEGSYVVSFN
tara:strand:- start:267 stop:671 length:405 start_codon:yes stop_codon:yes gene_type:complete